MSSIEESARRTALVITIVMIVATFANGLAWLTGALLTGAFVWVVLGLVGGVFFALSAFLWSSRRARVWSILLLMVLSIGGWIAAGLGANTMAAYVGVVHTLWVLVTVGGLVGRAIIRASYGVARTMDTTRAEKRAEQDRVASARARELDYAARVERTQNWVDRATRPGATTGYEPAALGEIDLPRSPFMFGEPGAGLGGSGFHAGAVARGQEGEINFAKALHLAGLLTRFATFWSVHMPDDVIGASTAFQTDIDCVVVTGRSVFLLDVKNFTQGDVTWIAEARTDEHGVQNTVLVAVDNVSNGYVGEPRKMSRNMQMATHRFGRRFADAGIALRVSPAVVLMPRPEGLGRVEGVYWPDRIPATGLPQLLGWLQAEPPFRPDAPDSALVVAILKALVKDASGSAITPGQRVAPAPVPSASAAHVVPDASAVPARAVCGECQEPVESDWAFCYSCGANL